jgi:type I restriction enzyme, S subunit
MFLLSTLFEEQIALLSAGSTIQHFGPSHLSRMKAPLPPANEQAEIASRLSAALARTGDTTAKVNTSIDRLKEYRSALITAAVTGQIDVAAHAKSGTPDRRLDAIQEEMGA